MNWKVPFFSMALGDRERIAVQDVLDSNWLTMGPFTERFEKAFAHASGQSEIHAVALSSCTAALHLAFLALDIGPGDEVLCPSLTFVASANAIRYTGATPVFIDIRSEDDWTLDPDDVLTKITKRTRAVLAVHYGGYSCRMNALLDVARDRGLKVVEDSAHSLFAEAEDGQVLGTMGDIGCFSFFSNKNMTTGEGGMALTRNGELAERIRLLRSHGMTSSTLKRHKGHASGYDVVALGYNYRIDEIRAAIGIAQLEALDANNARRKSRVEQYRVLLKERLPLVVVPFGRYRGRPSYHIFPILLPDGVDRETTAGELTASGIQTSVHYRPVHTFAEYACYPASVSKTDRLAGRILTLPLFPSMGEPDIHTVVDALALCLTS